MTHIIDKLKLTKLVFTLFACLAATTLGAQETVTDAFQDLQRKGQVLESESEMRIKPTAAEVTKLVAKLPESGYFCFTEERTNSVRMLDIIPQRWAVRNVEELNTFTATAQPNEFFTFQVAAWAVKKELRGITVEFSDLKNSNGETIGKNLLSCFNTGGIDLEGKNFSKTIDVPRRTVQPFWIGVDIPRTAKGIVVQ